jgi:hypothetical protein
VNPEKEIHITLDPRGQVSVEVFNVIGPSCSELSQPYTDLFETVGDVKKQEFRVEESTTLRQTERL